MNKMNFKQSNHWLRSKKDPKYTINTNKNTKNKQPNKNKSIIPIKIIPSFKPTPSCLQENITFTSNPVLNSKTITTEINSPELLSPQLASTSPINYPRI